MKQCPINNNCQSLADFCYSTFHSIMQITSVTFAATKTIGASRRMPLSSSFGMKRNLFILQILLTFPIQSFSFFIPSSPPSLLSSPSSFHLAYKYKHAKEQKGENAISQFSSTHLFMTQPLQEQQQQQQQRGNKNKNNENSKKNEWNTSLFPKPPKSQSKAVVSTMTTTSKIFPGSTTAATTNNELLPQTYVQLLAIGIGIVTGISVAGFKLSIDAIRQFCYGDGFHTLWNNLLFFSTASTTGEGEAVPYWIIPVLGGVMVTSLNNIGTFSPGLRGAVTEVDDDSLQTNNNDSNYEWDFRPLRKAMGATFTLGTGNSLGPEGPGVEIGVAVSRFYMMLWPPLGSKEKEYETYNDNENEYKINDALSSTEFDNESALLTMQNQAATVAETISRNRLLLACGAAAGVSSGFNAPLSGVFFALEVVQAALPSPLSIPILNNNDENDDDSSQTTMTTLELQQQSLSGNPGSITAILISSVVSTLVSRIFLGDELALQVLTYDISTPLSELPLYSLLGVFCGIVSVVFAQTAKLSKDVLEGEAGPALVKKYIVKLPAPILGGMTCGLVGYIYPQILFFGYETLNGLLENETLATELLLILLLAKIFTTAVSAGSGLVGGTLAPSLFMGGMTGASFHNIVSQGFIQLHIPLTIEFNGSILFDLATVPIYSSVGAASVLAATFRAPLTASLLLFEITRDYDLLLPLLVSAGVASLASDIIENSIINTSSKDSSSK